MANSASFLFSGDKNQEWVQEEFDFPESKVNYGNQFINLSPEQSQLVCDEANERHARGEISDEELDAFLAEHYPDFTEQPLTVQDIEQAHFIGSIALGFEPKILVKN
jgi:hypothetical protein